MKVNLTKIDRKVTAFQPVKGFPSEDCLVVPSIFELGDGLLPAPARQKRRINKPKLYEDVVTKKLTRFRIEARPAGGALLCRFSRP